MCASKGVYLVRKRVWPGRPVNPRGRVEAWWPSCLGCWGWDRPLTGWGPGGRRSGTSGRETSPWSWRSGSSCTSGKRRSPSQAERSWEQPLPSPGLLLCHEGKKWRRWQHQWNIQLAGDNLEFTNLLKPGFISQPTSKKNIKTHFVTGKNEFRRKCTNFLKPLACSPIPSWSNGVLIFAPRDS